MGDDALDQVGALIEAAVAAREVPAAVAMVGRGPATFGLRVAGQAGRGQPTRADTVFDLASLTKVVATTTATLALAGRGAIGLDDPVTGYLPHLAACRGGPVTIRHLLTHTSGLPGSRTFHRWCASRAELLDDLARTPLEAPPGSRVVYSDLGFIILGEVVAAAAGQPLPVAVRRLVTQPLGLDTTTFSPGVLVHDENARLMGGVAGHAGLFAPAADLARFAAWWVSDTDAVVPAALRRQAARCQTAGLGGRRGFGWSCSGDGFDILGGHWPPTAVSHTGFTGTSLALDPVTGLWMVLLTNAVHYGRDPAAIQALRRQAHAAVSPARTA